MTNWIMVYNPTDAGRIFADGHEAEPFKFSYADKDQVSVQRMLEKKYLLEVPIYFGPDDTSINASARTAAYEVKTRRGDSWVAPPSEPQPLTYTQMDTLLRTGRLSPAGVAAVVADVLDDATIDGGTPTT